MEPPTLQWRPRSRWHPRPHSGALGITVSLERQWPSRHYIVPCSIVVSIPLKRSGENRGVPSTTILNPPRQQRPRHQSSVCSPTMSLERQWRAATTVSLHSPDPGTKSASSAPLRSPLCKSGFPAPQSHLLHQNGLPVATVTSPAKQCLPRPHRHSVPGDHRGLPVAIIQHCEPFILPYCLLSHS